MLVALHGPLGSGKTTAAKVLVDLYGFVRVSFAAPLYDMLEAGGFGRPETLEQKMAVMPGLSNALGKEITWRHAAQTLGTEWGRRCLGENVWTALALAKCRNPDYDYVIDDCRFENEATAVREMGGTVVHIVGRRIESLAAGHESEKGIAFDPEQDFRLDNSGNKEQLVRRMLDMRFAVLSR